MHREKFWQISHIIGQIRSFNGFHTLRFLRSKQTQVRVNNADKNSQRDYGKDDSLDLLLDATLAIFALPIGSDLVLEEALTCVTEEHHTLLICVSAHCVMKEHGSRAKSCGMIKNAGDVTT